MERTAVRGRLNWLPAEVVELVQETPRVKTIVFNIPGWIGHQPGQHVDIRLTAEDGYQAQRSYSIANAKGGERVALTVEALESGEVSPYLVDELVVGDRIELRGPIGGYFVWDQSQGVDPLQLIAGGTGLVPLMAMIRSQTNSSTMVPTRLLVSARSWEELIYRDDLEMLAGQLGSLDVTYTLTRSQPLGWNGYSRRIDKDMLAGSTWTVADMPIVFICGPTGFVETAASTMLELGHQPERIKTERFGPSGG
jgi:ferredoxin-NADP reductase